MHFPPSIKNGRGGWPSTEALVFIPIQSPFFNIGVFIDTMGRFALCRGTDFPFQKIAFSVSENLQFRFNMVEKWKFRFPIEIVHTKYWKFRLHRDVCYKYIRGSAEELHGNIFI